MLHRPNSREYNRKASVFANLKPTFSSKFNN